MRFFILLVTACALFADSTRAQCTPAFQAVRDLRSRTDVGACLTVSSTIDSLGNLLGNERELCSNFTADCPTQIILDYASAVQRFNIECNVNVIADFSIQTVLSQLNAVYSSLGYCHSTGNGEEICGDVLEETYRSFDVNNTNIYPCAGDLSSSYPNCTDMCTNSIQGYIDDAGANAYCLGAVVVRDEVLTGNTTRQICGFDIPSDDDFDALFEAAIPELPVIETTTTPPIGTTAPVVIPDLGGRIQSCNSALEHLVETQNRSDVFQCSVISSTIEITGDQPGFGDFCDNRTISCPTQILVDLAAAAQYVDAFCEESQADFETVLKSIDTAYFALGYCHPTGGPNEEICGDVIDETIRFFDMDNEDSYPCSSNGSLESSYPSCTEACTSSVQGYIDSAGSEAYCLGALVIRDRLLSGATESQICGFDIPSNADFDLIYQPVVLPEPDIQTTTSTVGTTAPVVIPDLSNLIQSCDAALAHFDEIQNRIDVSTCFGASDRIDFIGDPSRSREGDCAARALACPTQSIVDLAAATQYVHAYCAEMRSVPLSTFLSQIDIVYFALGYCQPTAGEGGEICGDIIDATYRSTDYDSDMDGDLDTFDTYFCASENVGSYPNCTDMCTSRIRGYIDDAGSNAYCLRAVTIRDTLLTGSRNRICDIDIPSNDEFDAIFTSVLLPELELGTTAQPSTTDDSDVVASGATTILQPRISLFIAETLCSLVLLTVAV